MTPSLLTHSLILVSSRTGMATTANAKDLIGAMHRPKAFVAAALHFGWLPDIIQDLIQLIASYACTPRKVEFGGVVLAGVPLCV